MKDLLQTIVAVFLGVIISMGGFWLMLGRDLPTRAEVSQMIAIESPYVRDQAYIKDRLDKNDEVFKEIADNSKNLEKAVNELRIQMAILTEIMKKIQLENYQSR